jgi:1-acyl-sn-glycerol-3-phosphate acyltransferase
VARPILTELGLYKLWGEDPERTQVFARAFMAPLTRALSESYAYGVDRVPASGGIVIAANHFSTVDPLFLGIFTRRAIYFMAKLELLDMPVFGEVLRWLGAFAVRRGEGDRDSLRVARWLAAEGHAVGFFMEGTRQQLGYPSPGHAGAAMVAIQEGVPVVPCGIDTFQWSMGNRRPCALVWGEPLDLGGLGRNGRGYKEGARIVDEAILGLWRQAANAVVDRFPEELPDGAPRSAQIGSRGALRIHGPSWPHEDWAAEPLGPVYREAG